MENTFHECLGTDSAKGTRPSEQIEMEIFLFTYLRCIFEVLKLKHILIFCLTKYMVIH